MSRFKRSAWARTLALAALLAAGPGQAADPDSRVVAFTETTPLASNRVLAERLLTPLAAAAIPRRLAALGERLREQPIDLGTERFRVHVPPTMPAGGYGVLVFVPPWDDNRLPEGWAKALDARGIIFVSPTGAGNDATSLGRREPLAILAAVNVAKVHPVNPARVFVAGFSGGAKVALRLAVAYPDLFRGAFLDAGADPIGEPDFALPPRDLFERFRLASRLAFFAGADDRAALGETADALSSLRRWCAAAGAAARSGPGLGHAVAPASAVAWALGILDAPPPPAEAACWGTVSARLAGELARVRDAVKRRDAGAGALLGTVDRRYGGLAAPESLALAGEIAAHSATSR